MLRHWICAALLAPALAARADTVLNHSGYLLDASDVPVERVVTLRATLFAAASPQVGESILWTDTYTVSVVGGRFVLELGGTRHGGSVPIPDAVFAGADARFLALTVDETVTLLPRVRVGTVPMAVDAQRLGGIAATEYVRHSQLGAAGTAAIDASRLTSGVLDDARIPATVARVGAANTTFGGLVQATNFAGNGVQLTNVDAARLGGKTLAQIEAGVYGRSEADQTFVSKTSLASTHYTRTEADTQFAPKAGMSAYYTRTEADTQFATQTSAQRRISGNCQAGSFITSVNADGTVQCAAAMSDVQVTPPLSGNGNTTPLSIAKASSTADGLLSKADKSRLDGLRNTFNMTFEVKNINSGRRTIEPRFGSMAQAQSFSFDSPDDYAGGGENWYADIPWTVPGTISWYTTPQTEQLNGRMSVLWTVGVGDAPHPSPRPETRIAILQDCRGAHHQYITTGSPTPNYSEPRLFMGYAPLQNYLITGQQYGTDNYLDMGVLLENAPMGTCLGTRSIRVINLGPNRIHVHGIWAVHHGTERTP